LTISTRIQLIIAFKVPGGFSVTHIFISYSHADKSWLDRLKVQLKPYEREFSLDIWDDRKIKPGAQWKKEIEEALNAAKVAVLLVTPDFLASEFIANEELPPLLDRAKRGGVTIFWIATAASSYHVTAINEYQCANDPNNPLDSLGSSEQNRVLVSICEKIAREVRASLAARTTSAPGISTKSWATDTTSPLEQPPPANPNEHVEALAYDLAYGAQNRIWAPTFSVLKSSKGETWASSVQTEQTVADYLNRKWQGNAPTSDQLEAHGYLRIQSQLPSGQLNYQLAEKAFSLVYPENRTEVASQDFIQTNCSDWDKVYSAFWLVRDLFDAQMHIGQSNFFLAREKLTNAHKHACLIGLEETQPADRLHELASELKYRPESELKENPSRFLGLIALCLNELTDLIEQQKRGGS
jgi:hypothetical protein